MHIREEGSVYKNRYKVINTLHTKGMSFVYTVFDMKLEKLVCLKEVVKAQAGRDAVNLDSVRRETKLLRSLNHPGIPRILDVEETAERYSILMDLVTGYSLEELYRRRPKMFTQDFVVSKMSQLALILGYLHKLPEPIFYRDLKPGNIMLQDGNVRLLDFGISERITPSNRYIQQPLGSRGFAAPEQAKVGTAYDLRSDIYSFGVTMYVLLEGHLPKSAPCRPEHASQGIQTIVEQCTQLDPAERFQSMPEVFTALQNIDLYDSRVLSASRHKIHAFYASVLTAALLFGAAGSSYALGIHEDSVSYQSLVAVAQKENTIPAYVRAIDKRPDDIDTYFKVIDLIKSGDGVFSSEEEQQFLPTLTGHLNDIKRSPRYPEFAYKMGELYWFFFQDNAKASGKLLSIPWFSDAVDGGYNSEQAKIFYNLGAFYRDISSAVQTSSDTGMYRAYWNGLTSLDINGSGEVVTLQLYNNLTDFIYTYTYRLQTDGVPIEDIHAQLNTIQGYLDKNPPSPGRPEELAKTLREKLDKLPTHLAAVYGE